MPLDYRRFASGMAATGAAAQQQPAQGHTGQQTAKPGPITTGAVARPSTPDQWQLQGGFNLYNPGAAEYAYAGNAATLQQPGATEQYAAGQPSQQQARDSTAAGQYWQGLYGAQGAQSAATYNPATATASANVDPGAASIGSQYGQTRTGSMGNFVPPEMSFGDVAADTAAGRYAAQLDPFAQGQERVSDVGPTAAGQNLQDFRGSTPANLDALYSRQFDTGSERIDRAMASRGMFDSSVAVDAQRELAADLAASQVGAEADYGLARAAEARQSSSAADDAAAQRFGLETGVDLSRRGLGLEASRAADDAAIGLYEATGDYGLGRGSLALAGASAADDAARRAFESEAGYGLDRSRLNLDAATAEDAARMGLYGADTSRIGAMSGSARGADVSAQGVLDQGLETARASDDALLGRLGTLGQGAALADSSRLNRTDTTYDNLYGSTAGMADQLTGLYGASIGQDQALFDMAQQMDLGSGLQMLQGALQSGQINGQQMANLMSAAQQGDESAMQMLQMFNS